MNREFTGYLAGGIVGIVLTLIAWAFLWPEGLAIAFVNIIRLFTSFVVIAIMFVIGMAFGTWLRS